jgi:hypothetical protein
MTKSLTSFSEEFISYQYFILSIFMGILVNESGASDGSGTS